MRVRGRVTEAKLRTAIGTMLDTRTVRSAQEFGARLDTEDGVANACAVIESHLAR